jgi:hypothetical protein
MDLDGLFSGPELVGDLLVEQPGDYSLHDFEFPRRQRFEAGPGSGVIRTGSPLFQRSGKGSAHRVEQVFLVDWFNEKVDGARFHRLGAHRHIAVTGNENNLGLSNGEGLLEFQAVDSGHLDVEYQAGGSIVRWTVEISAGRTKRFRLDVSGAKQAQQTPTDGFVVVHDENYCIRRKR